MSTQVDDVAAATQEGVLVAPMLTHFQPQQWIYDYAVDSDHARVFDAAVDLMDMPGPRLVQLVEESTRGSLSSFDDLADDAMADGRLRRHDGPHFMWVDTDLLVEWIATHRPDVTIPDGLLDT